MNGQEWRDFTFGDQKRGLQALAWRAQSRGMTNRDCVVVAIEVDDPYFRPLVDHLMPNADWNDARARGETPIARGSVDWGVVNLAMQMAPDTTDALSTPAPAGIWFAIVMGKDGISVYHIVPQPADN